MPFPEVPAVSRPSTLLLAAVALPLFTGNVAADVLKIDFGDRTDAASVPAAGFSPFLIDSVVSGTSTQSGSSVRTFGAITVTLSPIGVGTVYDDRRRTAPVSAGAFTEDALLQDFVFTGTTVAGAGLAVEVSGLLPDRGYPASIWSFDSGSTGARTADWVANGVPVRSNYVFSGNVLPADNSTYRFDFIIITDSAGKVTIQGLRDPFSVGSTLLPAESVFLNALRIGDPFADTDGDKMDDAWEALHGLDTASDDSAADKDSDGLANLAEFARQLLPDDSDTDNDGFSDSQETATGVWAGADSTGTDPLDADTDNDSIPDGIENASQEYAGPSQPGSDPNLIDSDGDGFSDPDELELVTNPADDVHHPASTGTLAVDFGKNDGTLATPPAGSAPSPVQKNWREFLGVANTLAGASNLFISPGYPAGINVAVTGVGTVTIDDRDRAPPAGNVNYQNLYRDFVFAVNSDAAGDGMDVTITGLQPSTIYPVLLVMFDRSSASRSQWFATDNGGPAVFKAANAFAGVAVNGITDPNGTSLRNFSVRFLFKTDAAGRIVLQGRRAPDATTTHNVFLNAILIRDPYVPMDFTLIDRNAEAGNIALSWQSVPYAPYQVEFSDALSTWTPASGIIHGAGLPALTTSATVAAPDSRTFVRVRRTDL